MLLTLAPGALGQHLAGGHSGGVSGGHVGGFSGGGVHGGFSGGGFHGGFSTNRSFRGFSGPAPRGFGAPSRMTWSAPRYSFAPRRGAYEGFRPPYSAGARSAMNRGGDHGGHRGDHRGRYRPQYPGYGYGGYPYNYANSWELLPWDIGYPDFTDYGDNEDNDTAGPQNAQAEPFGGEQPPPQEGGGYVPEYAPGPYQPPAEPVAASTPPRNEPRLTLIFKNGRTMDIRNYVLTPSEIIVMDDAASGREPRIPLAEINLPATEKAASQGGLDFSPPST